MYKIKQIGAVCASNFRKWRRSPQIWLSFALAFIACFLLSDKVTVFAERHGTTLQISEAFIWTFGDSISILLISLCLLLLFADVPRLENDVPFLLVRTSRMRFVLGQILYIITSTAIFTAFIFLSTSILTGVNSFTSNNWSDTAAILGYSNIGHEIAVPSYVKVLEFSFPYPCAVKVFLLLLGYSLFMSSIIFFFNLLRSKAGLFAGIVYSGFGLILTPKMVSTWFHLPAERYRVANIMFGWLSPLNQATYYMHNFGYDNLPRMWQSYLFFGAGSLFFFVLSAIKIRRYAFNFTGSGR